MAEQEKSGDKFNVTISGDVSGQVAVGKGNTQIQSPSEAPNAESPSPYSRAERARLAELRHTLTTRFDQGELRTLCFDLGLDYDDLPGSGKADRARELVAHLARRERISELLKAGRQLRPDIAWEEETSEDEEIQP